ncbi:hypothetical protein ACGFIW_01305 [Micromonospora sp. NPDC048935]|uniref:hypothetical protein n=1 Tax=Micromonospora sp. NPDC048935 TaxID=3364262 RepID=UPI003716A959
MTAKLPADLNPGDRIRTGTQNLTVRAVSPHDVELEPNMPAWLRYELMRCDDSTATTATTVRTQEGYRLIVADDYEVSLIARCDERPLGPPGQAIRALFARM